jgi:hypothetical protein
MGELELHGSKDYLMLRITTIDFPDDRGGAIIEARREHAMFNEYVAETMVASKLAEAREAAARRALARRARAPHAFRAWLGTALIRLGHRLTPPDPAEAPSHAH